MGRRVTGEQFEGTQLVLRLLEAKGNPKGAQNLEGR
jgi:hypothetical protein